MEHNKNISTQTKRLFVGIPLPEDFVRILHKFQKHYSSVYGIRWVAPENLHLTLCFIGKTPIDKIAELEQKIKELITEIKPFRLDYEHLCFAPPQKKKPYMIWATFKKKQNFIKLVLNLNNTLIEKQSNNRKIIPHITLARFNKKNQYKKININYDIHIKKIFVEKIVLWESILHSSGSEYKIVKVFELR